MPHLSFRDKRFAWYVEAPLLVVGYFAFGLARAAVDRGDPAATDNALLVQGLERFLRIAVEQPLNQAMTGHPVAIHLTGYFYRLSVVAVPIILIWLYLTKKEHYGRLRTALVVMMLADVLLVWAFPEAPPRFAQPGIVDHLAEYDILFSAESRVPRPGVNLLAAMPSMHVAWTTWCGYALWSTLRAHRPRLAWAAWAFPALTAIVVLVTGHHYVLDILAGVSLVAFGLVVAKRSAGMSQPSVSSPCSPP
ncbi:phosphatase PAP2 family protein [Actinosynnema sp. NPDC050436]|uniref:phosphatase PAP2 family protein n=1 Tax=Actinosynnema sp. NPDC050436 TaxID=3155659 RepID=UPI0033CDCCB0